MEKEIPIFANDFFHIIKNSEKNFIRNREMFA